MSLHCLTRLFLYFRRVTLGGALALMVSAGALAQAAAEAPRVVVSVNPIHSLVAGVMAGVGTPRLLVRGAASPHNFSLRPSDARALSRADAVFWVGPDFETFLDGALAALAPDARVIALGDTPGLNVLRARRGGVWGEDDEETDGPGQGNRDPHVWLDPRNARLIVEHVVASLSSLDPDNAPAYRANRDRLVRSIGDLDRVIAARLDRVRQAPFLVFHDAYQYLETRYGLNVQGALSGVVPTDSPGARRLSELRRRLVETKAACLFGEPQFESALPRALIRGTSAELAVLDPLGAGISPGPEAYFTIMREIVDNLVGCLSRRS